MLIGLVLERTWWIYAYLQETWDVLFAGRDFSPIIVFCCVCPICFDKRSSVHKEELHQFWWTKRG